jgi:signal transduction histidine kinase
MLNVLKPSGAKVIGWSKEPFQRSRLILTAIYAIILASILVISSTVTTNLFFNRLDRRVARIGDRALVRLERAGMLPPSSEDVRGELLSVTYLVNSLLFMVAVVLSYWLAGLTLKPIKLAYDRQRQFLSDVSHELRTPLAILQTNLENELLLSNSETNQVALHSHLEEVGRMGSLIRDILTLSRLQDAEHAHHSDVTVNLASVASQAVNRLQVIADKQGIKLSLEAEAGLNAPVTVTNDDLLLQALTNVIQNAITYNKAEGQVTVKVLVQSQVAQVIVSDTGVGIPEHEQAKIFDRFYRVEKSRSRQTGGSGLGLAIVKSIFDLFHGQVKIESQINQGTTVTLELPLSTEEI